MEVDDDKAGGASAIIPTESPSTKSDFAQAGQPAEDGEGESLDSLTRGLPLEEIEEIRRAQALIPAYELLHALVGRNERDFLIRAAALDALMACGHAAFSQHDLDEALYWLNVDARERTVRALREVGWLEYKSGSGDIITDAGRSAFEILQLLRRKLESGELLPTVVSLEHALNVGASPLGLLDALLLKLNQNYADVEEALASHSEIILRNAVGKIEDALNHSRKINELLDRVPKDTPRTWPRIREIHDRLSRLHGRLAELHAAITEVGRQYLHLTRGLTVQQIVEALMSKPKELLARTGREALLPTRLAPPLLNTDALAYRAAVYFARERIRVEKVNWEEPPEILYDARGEEQISSEVSALLQDLDSIGRGLLPTTLRQLIPRNDKVDSFLRASLLPLAGNHSSGVGITGRFSALRVEIYTEGDGWPEDLLEGPLASLTPGSVRPAGPARCGDKKP